MSVQIATDPDGLTTTRAIGRAAVWFSSIFLAITAAIVTAFIPLTGRLDILVAVAALAVIGAAVAGALSSPTTWRALLWTAVALVSLFGYASIVTNVAVTTPGPTPSSDTVLLSMPALAVLLCGVALRSLRGALIVGTAAFVGAQGLVLAAASLQGMPLALDVPVIASWIGLALLLIAYWHGRGVTALGSSVMSLAGDEEFTAATTGRFSVAATEWLRDTVLDDLHELASAQPGPLSAQQVATIRRHLVDLDDIAPILAESTLSAVPPATTTPAMLLDVVETGRRLGVSVDLVGQLSAVALLPASVTRRLETALEECLKNVAVHSGVTVAEVAVMDGEGEVSVMVSDAGTGFDPDALEFSDRTGLRTRVVDRLTEVGGSVQIWARPGGGTAVFLTVVVGS